MRKKSALSRTVEILVMVMISLAIVYPTICVASYWFMRDKYNSLLRLYESPYLSVCEILFCIVLTLWLKIGDGVNSKLWLWLPPFVFFRKMGTYVRAMVVIFLIIAPLIVLVGELLGIISYR